MQLHMVEEVAVRFMSSETDLQSFCTTCCPLRWGQHGPNTTIVCDKAIVKMLRCPLLNMLRLLLSRRGGLSALMLPTADAAHTTAAHHLYFRGHCSMLTAAHTDLRTNSAAAA